MIDIINTLSYICSINIFLDHVYLLYTYFYILKKDAPNETFVNKCQHLNGTLFAPTFCNEALNVFIGAIWDKIALYFMQI